MSINPHGRNAYRLRGKLYDREGNLVEEIEQQVKGNRVAAQAPDGETLLSMIPHGRRDYLVTGKLYDRRGGEVAEINEEVGIHLIRSGGLELG